MKWRSFFCLLPCLLLQNLVSGSVQITMEKTGDYFIFTCPGTNWTDKNSDKLSFPYKDEHSGDYTCGTAGTLTVKFRTCESCIQVDQTSFIVVIVGNIVATFFVAFAVYSITAQSKGKSFSGNKASDKVNLLPNGEGDTYQQLNPGQSAEYSRLKGGRKT